MLAEWAAIQLTRVQVRWGDVEKRSYAGERLTWE
jgi:hypothetical protein